MIRIEITDDQEIVLVTDVGNITIRQHAVQVDNRGLIRTVLDVRHNSDNVDISGLSVERHGDTVRYQEKP